MIAVRLHSYTKRSLLDALSSWKCSCWECRDIPVSEAARLMICLFDILPEGCLLKVQVLFESIVGEIVVRSPDGEYVSISEEGSRARSRNGITPASLFPRPVSDDSIRGQTRKKLGRGRGVAEKPFESVRPRAPSARAAATAQTSGDAAVAEMGVSREKTSVQYSIYVCMYVYIYIYIIVYHSLILHIIV